MNKENRVASLDRGTKRQCLHCSTKFYDLNRDPILCPSCGKQFVVEVVAPPTPKPVKEKVEKEDKDKEEEVAADPAAPEVISINDVVEDDDDDDDDDDAIPDVEDVEVDDELGGDDDDAFLEDDDEDDDKIAFDVTSKDDDN